MRRRDVLRLLAGGTAYAPFAAFAEHSEQIRLIGVLIGVAADDPSNPRRVEQFQLGLEELGWSERRNIKIAYRWALEREQIRASAKELLALKPDIIVASSSLVASTILQENQKVPVVFVTASDPVGDRLVASLARPGGNATGFTNSLATVGGKWVELLREIAPGLKRVAIIFNRETAPTGGVYFLQPIESAASAFGIQPFATPVPDRAQIERMLTEFAREPGGSLIVMPDTFMTIHRDAIITQAARLRLPAIYPFRYFAADGGLMSYGPDLMDLYRRTPAYIDRILRGAKPSELPVQAPSKFEFVVNLKAAKQLGLTMPRILIAGADEVIE